MLFNSPEFIVFFLIVYFLYLGLTFRLQNYVLLVASYIFYGWWDTRFLFLVALSTTIDFWVGLMIENGRLLPRQWLLPALFLVTSAVAFLGLRPAVLLPHADGGLNQGELISVSMIEWSLAGVIVFVAFILLVFFCLRGIDEPRRRLGCLMVSLIVQLGLLGIFKYFNFFADSLSAALNNIGVQSSSLHLNIVLPVGVSFYTFQSLSYTIDIYRKQFKPTDRFIDFALFVAYFPQLQAGPIERARHLIPQLSKPRTIGLAQISNGLYLIILGFFKKVAIADGVSPVVDQIFSSNGQITWIDVVVGTVLFAMQIYCDFSGYTDIARGISKLLGIELVVNFNQPYFASNPQEFWRRWHISLSTWLRDYLYVPLGGNHGTLLFVCRNLMITMLLGGLWHGAAWNFVLWGFYQGILLCLYRSWCQYWPTEKLSVLEASKWAAATSFSTKMAANVVFFICVCYGWLLFRSHSLTQIGKFSSLLITDFGNFDYGGGTPRLSALVGLPLLVLVEIGQFWNSEPQSLRWLPVPARGALMAALLVIIAMGMSNEPAQFIYFQF
jgi:alginate O-acetyltransferase complex protein AlgI